MVETMSLLSPSANTRTSDSVTAGHPLNCVEFLPQGSDRATPVDHTGPGTRLSFLQRRCRSVALRALAQLDTPGLIIDEGATVRAVGNVDYGSAPTVRVHRSRFWKRLALGGSLGAAESYIDGDWDCDRVVSLMELLARHARPLAQIERRSSLVTRLWIRLRHAVRRNSPSGSRRNIAAHYDLSNELFAAFLDETMTYSSGIFASPKATLKEASIAKYDRIARKLQLTPRDHLLEIGSGWGGFAIHAARNYGCRVTATTISGAQYQLAAQRIADAGLGNRIRLLQSDYRDLQGTYDKLVSIEMIEAVGERYLNPFFRKCSRLLKTDGSMLLQSIVMPDCRYDRYRRSVDFIQRYVFPGGFLPSHAAIGQCVRYNSDLQLVHLETFGLHYAETLARWRRRFAENLVTVSKLGFDQRFIRTWVYYLCYCEAGFRQRQVDVSQMMFVKPQSTINAWCEAPPVDPTRTDVGYA